MAKISVTPALVSRFFEKVEVGKRHQCWPFIGLQNKRGYGQFCITVETKSDEMLPAPHVALAIAGMSRPEGLCALHKCDNPSCVNPSHLYWGTQADNAHDRETRGRGNHKGLLGEKNSQAKLTAEQVLEIRASPKGALEISKDYGVSHATIIYIRQRKRWAHI